MEYVGENLELDMAAIAEDPTTLEWWELTAPLQMSLRADTGDEWWTQIPEVFHMDGRLPHVQSHVADTPSCRLHVRVRRGQVAEIVGECVRRRNF